MDQRSLGKIVGLAGMDVQVVNDSFYGANQLLELVLVIEESRDLEIRRGYAQIRTCRTPLGQRVLGVRGGWILGIHLGVLT